MRMGLSDKKDEDIAKLVQSGEIEPFAVLVNRYDEKIKRYGRKFLSGKEDIEDITQKVFINAYKNIQSFDVKRKFSPWLYRIAHNEFINELKRKKREPFKFFDLDVVFPHLLAYKEKYGQATDRSIINKNLDKLSNKYKEIIILRYFEELSYKEISDVLEIPISTVGIRLKRGINKLREIYG